MDNRDAAQHYDNARKLALREYSRNISRGLNGYLPYLEGILKNIEIVSEVDLGIDEIPIKNIAGTNSYSRSRSFASNFMPLLAYSSEFGKKWISLCSIHLDEGIRDPIKVYEYLNWYYVIEGNKRTSVLKYFDAYSIPARVLRLIPKKDATDPVIMLYYEYLDFYKKTRINRIWFSKEKSYEQLLGYMEEYKPAGTIYGDKYKSFIKEVFEPFRSVYREAGGDKLSVTTGDAFLEYVRLFGLPVVIDENELKANVKILFAEREYFRQWGISAVQMEPLPDKDSGIISAITAFVMPKKKLKVAFAYARTAQKSNWTYSHDLGRIHVEDVFKDQISTTCMENVPENAGAYDYLKQLAEEGNDVVFSTSPAFLNASLKAALEYRNVKFLNCSDSNSFKHVYCYYGRIYEARFLTGIIAGAMTQSDIIGYVGTYPIPGVISGINAFALGARLVNPHATVKVAWTNQWESNEGVKDASTQLMKLGADIVSHQNTLANRRLFREFGVYSTLCNVNRDKCVPEKYIAAPVWNWGIFYEKILRNILGGTLPVITDILGTASKMVNFWWGLDTGIVDIFYSTRFVPKETQKLVGLMKRMISDGTYHPFTGPVYDSNNVLRIKKDETANYTRILSMDWFVDAVESESAKLMIGKTGMLNEPSANMIEQEKA